MSHSLSVSGRYLAAFFIGCALVFSHAPFSFAYLALPLLILLFYWLPEGNWQQHLRYGLAFGLGYFGLGISWVYVSIDRFGGLAAPLSVLLVLLLALYLALYPALALALNRRFFAPPYWSLSLPALWLLAEWLRAHLLSGFPWLGLGYAQTDTLLGSLLPVIGQRGVGYLLIALSIATSQLLRRQHRPLAFAVLSLSLVAIGLAGIRQTAPASQAPSLTLALVQGNIPQKLRWAPEEQGPIMQHYRRLTRQHPQADIVIWPEAAIPATEIDAQNFLHQLDKAARFHHQAIVTGIVEYLPPSGHFYNSVIVLGDNDSHPYRLNNSNRYRKHQLVPIGEFVPFERWLRPLAPLFNLPMSSFAAGAYIQPNLNVKGVQLVTAICYEIAFTEQIRANIQAHSQAILTLSNDAWFGNSHGPHQHLQIARVRAMEYGLPVIRATNNGITAIIDGRGQIQKRLAQFTTAVLESPLPPALTTTPYRRFGDWPLFSLAILSLLAVAWLSLRQSRFCD